jgi:murein L,D-transpeptidase YcbB/YkuD
MRSDRRSFLTGMGAFAATALSGSAFAQDAIQSIINAPRRGNWDEQFDARASDGAKVQSTLPILSPQTVSYIEQAILQYSNIVDMGGWPVVPAAKKLQLGVVDPDVEILRRRLMISGDLAQQAGISPAFDSYVDSAVKRFQARHGMPSDGIMGEHIFKAMNVSAPIRLGQLQTNLERLRAMAFEPLGNRYVMVNIPAAEVEAVENGRVALRNNAVVGKIDRQTPILNSEINEVIINPYWNAPESIVRRDIIPLMRKNPNYLKENNIRILGPNGEIDPMTIDWSTEEAAKLHFRQDPGKINAMASVKINFPNPHAVYIHDTPMQSLFNEIDRFHSSGCVRVQNVRDLVTWLLRDTDGWNRQRFEQTIQTGQSTPVQLAATVPVYFTYISAWSTGDGVAHLRDDIYAMDGVAELQISTAL